MFTMAEVGFPDMVKAGTRLDDDVFDKVVTIAPPSTKVSGMGGGVSFAESEEKQGTWPPRVELQSQ